MRDRSRLSALAVALALGAAAWAGDAAPAGRRIAALKFLEAAPGAPTPWIGAGAREVLCVKLGAVRGLWVTPTSRITAVLNREWMLNADFRDPKTAARAGRALNVERVVSATYRLAGSEVIFSLRVLDVATGATLRGVVLRKRRHRIQDLVSQLADEVLRSYSVRAVRKDGKVSVEPASAAERIELNAEQREAVHGLARTNLQAYEAFSKGLAATRTEDEIRWQTRAIRLAPRYAWAYRFRGVAWVLKGKPDHALADLNEAIALRPDYGEAYYDRGAALQALHRPKQALASFSEAIKLRRSWAEAYNARGVSYYAEKELKAALRDLAEAIRIRPDWAVPYRNRAEANLVEGRLKDAVRDATRAIAVDPSLSGAYVVRARAWLRLGGKARARADIAKLRALGARVPSDLSRDVERTAP